MMGTVFSPLGIFIIFLALVWGLYAVSGLIAPKCEAEGKKLSMYSCGEPLPEGQHASSASMFFHIALYFTIMDVAALTIATLPKESSIFLGVFYIIGISIAVFALILR